MKICKRTLYHNEQPTEQQIAELKKFYNQLTDKLSKKPFVKHIKVKQSHTSEALYIRLYGYKRGRVMFSIRNHDSYADCRQDNIYLSDFKTLEELEKYVILFSEYQMTKKEY